MNKFNVATVQQRMRLYDSVEAYEQDLRRFLRMAKMKSVRLIVFPELSGLMAAVPMIKGMTASLLRTSDHGHQHKRSLWQRAKSSLARGATNMLGADLRKGLMRLLDTQGHLVWTVYQQLFSELAQEYDIIIVAGSTYLVDPKTADVHNVATVFGNDGDVLGQQAKVRMNLEEHGWAEPGAGWTVIETKLGRLGVLFGNDLLYPEAGRALAYQGADFFVGLGACIQAHRYHKLRAGMLARVQENQLYGALSFLIGSNPLTPTEGDAFVGKSVIFAPLELTTRYTGVMVEMGTHQAEGIITAPWDMEALHRLWEESDTPIRRDMPLPEAAPILIPAYTHGHTIAVAWESREAGQTVPGLPAPEVIHLPGPEEAAVEEVEEQPAQESAPEAEEAAGEAAPTTGPTTVEEVVRLDELPVLGVSEAYPSRDQQDEELSLPSATEAEAIPAEVEPEEVPVEEPAGPAEHGLEGAEVEPQVEEIELSTAATVGEETDNGEGAVERVEAGAGRETEQSQLSVAADDSSPNLPELASEETVQMADEEIDLGLSVETSARKATVEEEPESEGTLSRFRWPWRRG
ncbi:MAG TPA: hypothetical protein EYP04_06755 [Anaerolineae bacterium]|nr:hypothetical protein [Anaerolineae bacterium]HIQ04445.1 hypothetical protein [Anaerolineae bacterium]